MFKQWKMFQSLQGARLLNNKKKCLKPEPYSHAVQWVSQYVVHEKTGFKLCFWLKLREGNKVYPVNSKIFHNEI